MHSNTERAIRAGRGRFPMSAGNAIGVMCLAISVAAASPVSGEAFVRVNQVGYPSGASKRAYLMASAAETAATFAVKNSSGATVFSAPIGANLGAWSGPFSFVYALDFTSVITAGTDRKSTRLNSSHL